MRVSVFVLSAFVLLYIEPAASLPQKITTAQVAPMHLSAEPNLKTSVKQVAAGNSPFLTDPRFAISVQREGQNQGAEEADALAVSANSFATRNSDNAALFYQELPPTRWVVAPDDWQFVRSFYDACKTCLNFPKFEITPTVILHWGRNERNDLDPVIKMDRFLTEAQFTSDAAKEGWFKEVTLAPEDKEIFHQNEHSDVVKYTHPNGAEWVFDAASGRLITADSDKGTFNYDSNPVSRRHILDDIVPWIRWGSGPMDVTTFKDRYSLAKLGLSEQASAWIARGLEGATEVQNAIGVADSPSEANQKPEVSLSELDQRLFGASYGVKKKPIRDLLKEGADINARDEYGRSPLIIAIQHNTKSSIAKFLISKGADVSVADNEGNTAMHHAVLASTGTPPFKVIDGASLIRALISAGAPTNQENASGATPRSLLLDQDGFRLKFAEYQNIENLRRSRLNSLETHLVKEGLIDKRTFPSRKLTFGRILEAAAAGTIGGGVGQVRPAQTRQPSPRANSRQGAVTRDASGFSLVGVRMGQSYVTTVGTLRSKGFSPTNCTDYGISTGSPVYKTATFDQIMQRARGKRVNSSSYQGISRACFSNSQTSEHVSVSFSQYPKTERAKQILYESRDRLLSGRAFEARVRSKYGEPNVSRSLIRNTADMLYGSRNATRLVVWINQKKLMLSDQRISQNSSNLIREGEAQIQREIDSSGSARTSF